MPLDLDQNKARYQIRGYKPGLIQVNNQVITKSLIITPDQLFENWGPQTIADIQKASFDLILTIKPDILLIGTGSQTSFLPIELYGELINHGIGVEVMTTSAAARTYNALSAEERKIAAALILE